MPPTRWGARGSTPLWARRRLRHATGQSLTEYALIILMIAIAVFAVATLFGGALSATYGRMASSFVVFSK